MNKPSYMNTICGLLALTALAQCVSAAFLVDYNDQQQTAASCFDSDVTYPVSYYTPTEKTRFASIGVLQELVSYFVKCPANNAVQFDPFSIDGLSTLQQNLKHSTLVSLKSQLTI